jgi:hypothetical protein
VVKSSQMLNSAEAWAELAASAAGQKKVLFVTTTFDGITDMRSHLFVEKLMVLAVRSAAD